MDTLKPTQSTRSQTVVTSLAKIGITLKPYQVDGINWMFSLEAQSSGGILADDPGLGKTFQALSLVTSSPPDTTTLVVVPTTLITQWKQVAQQLLGTHAVYVHHGTRDHTKFPMTRVVITTYGIVRKELELANKRFHRIILDEGHEIKNKGSKISQAVMNLQAPLRWILSGTPVQNSEKDICNLFRFVLGHAPNTTQRIELTTLIQDKLLRRRKEDVLAGKIPELDIETLMIPFSSEKEEKFYFKVDNNVKREWQSKLEESSNAREANLEMFELLLRLRQVSQHPQLVLNGFKRKFGRDFGKWQETSSKHKALLEMLKTHPTEGSLVFSQFTEEIDILEKLLSENGFEILRLDGSISARERDYILEKANKKVVDVSASGLNLPTAAVNNIQSFIRPRVFLIQIKAGGVGLNLQAFSRVYLTSPDWNPCNEIQAIARSHRLGQTRKVVVKILVLNTPDDRSVIDDRILTVQDRKRNLMADLLEEEGLRPKQKTSLSTTDFRELLTKR